MISFMSLDSLEEIANLREQLEGQIDDSLNNLCLPTVLEITQKIDRLIVTHYELMIK